MKKVTMILAIILTMAVCTMNFLHAQTFDFWEFNPTFTEPRLNNVYTYGGKTIKEFHLRTNNLVRMQIKSDGKFFIAPRSGTVGGVTGELANSATMEIQGGGNSGLASYCFPSVDNRQNIQSYVSRSLTYSYIVNWNGADRFVVSGAGRVFAYSGYWGSDRSLKENIVPLQNSLDKVLQLKGYSFNLKAETLCAECDAAITSTEFDNSPEIGLIADEVETIVPEVVRTNPNNKKAIAYQNLVALLVESTKEQQRQINGLQAQVAKMMACNPVPVNPKNPIDISKLLQNTPNPFSGSTTICYYLIAGIGKADIVVWDKQGMEKKRFSLSNSQGNGCVTLLGSELTETGPYTYALLTDGQIAEAKTMMFVK